MKTVRLEVKDKVTSCENLSRDDKLKFLGPSRTTYFLVETVPLITPLIHHHSSCSGKVLLPSTSKSPVYHSHDRSHSFRQLTHLHTCQPGTQLVMGVRLSVLRIFEQLDAVRPALQPSCHNYKIRET